MAKIAEVTSTGTERFLDVIHNFNADGFEALSPTYRGDRPRTFALPGRQWAERGGKHEGPDREPGTRRRATRTRPHAARHLIAAYDLGKDKLYGHIKPKGNRTKFLESCRHLPRLHAAPQLLTEPHRGPVHCPALLHAGRH